MTQLWSGDVLPQAKLSADAGGVRRLFSGSEIQINWFCRK